MSSRRVSGALAASGAVLFSWVASSQPWSTGSWALLSRPSVLWNTFLTVDTGETDGSEEVRDIARSPSGELYIVGKQENDRTVTITDEDDLVVANFHADGGLGWAVAVGGKGVDDYDRANAIVLGSADEVYVAGETESNAFSVMLPDGGAGSTLKGSGTKDGFVARLNALDGGVLWFLHFGGSEDDEILDMAGVDGGLVIVGRTNSGTLPGTTDPSITSHEGFVSLLSLQGINPPRVEWTRFISGSGTQDEARGVAILPGAIPAIFVAGSTNSADLLSGVAVRNDFDGGDDGYLAKFDLQGRPSALHFLGGRGMDKTFGVVTDPSNNRVVVTGSTTSPDFMGTTAPDGGGAGLFVAQFDQNAQWLKTVRLVGTEATDRGALTPGENGSVYVGGRANSASVVLVNEFDRVMGGSGEGYVAQVQFEYEPAITWASFAGGNADDDHVLALHADLRGGLLIGGATSSTDVATYSASGHDRSKSNKRDLFLLAVAEQSLSDAGVTDGGAPQDAGLPPTDAGMGGGDGGTGEAPGLESPLGWSCGASATGGGPGALALGTLVGLAPRACRRRKSVTPPRASS
ncbi:hypothetical protein [Archangium sp.]|uniref:hypothetical protein n=1 Tax=Archangium sp. TaxID=1872627 RepID=UPI00286B6199|nr:hypothetical protein [Archangium sp.]